MDKQTQERIERLEEAVAYLTRTVEDLSASWPGRKARSRGWRGMSAC